MNKKFLIYLPTFARPEICLQQAEKVHFQISALSKKHLNLDISFVISINCDSTYDIAHLNVLTNHTINHPVNFGGNINIALGFIYAKKHFYDFLWIIGDDEPIADTAIENIAETIVNSDFDLLIGSKNKYGKFLIDNSYTKLSKLTGGTPSFISSTIYSCNFSEAEAYNALKYEFTSFPHLIVINNLIERSEKTNVVLIPLDLICKLNERVFTYPKVYRSTMGARDSVVFFGKPLALVGVNNLNYQKKEFIKWWLINWHRVAMYYSEDDFRGKLLIAISKDHKILRPLILISKLPIWRLKNICDFIFRRTNA